MLKPFLFFTTNKDTYILIFVIAAILLLFIIAVGINLVARKHRHKKAIRDLEKRYETSHAILVGQDSQALRRLEIIAQSNLLFGDVHHTFLSRYEDIKNNLDHQAEMAIGVLEDLMEKKRYHGFGESFKTNREIVLYFEEQVTIFNHDIKEVLKSEEKCRVDALSEKEKLRRLKQLYFDHQSELSLVEDSFTTVFANIDKAFENFEECIDRAEYDEVSTILTRVNEVIDELNDIMHDLPIICSLVDNVVPEKIRALREAYNRMSNDNFPVHHLKISFVLEDMNNELAAVKEKLETLMIDGLQEELIAICDRCEELGQQFVLERESKVTFEKDCDEIYARVNRIEKDFIKLCNFIPDVKNEYLIEDTYIDKIDMMRSDISRLGTIKRMLDNFIHSSTKQPYSLLLTKMTALDEESHDIFESMQAFNDYLTSLAKDAQYAREYISKTYFQLKNADKSIRDLNVESFYDLMKMRFRQCYALLDKIDLIEQKKPINVRVLNDNVRSLEQLQSDLLKDIEDKSAMCIASESMVVYANRDRHRLSDVKMLLNQVETAFFDGEFEKAYLEVGNIVKKIQGNNN